MTTTGDVRRASRTALAPPDEGPGDQLAIRTDQADWTPAQMAALDAMGVRDSNGKPPPMADLLVFLHVARTSGLNPFRKQIYCIARWSNQAKKQLWTIQTSIDGFRIIRDRAAKRDGWTASYEDPVWYDDNLKEFRVWKPGAEKPPFACKWVSTKVAPDGTVLGRYPKIIRFDAYADTDTNGKRRNRWANDPDGMIAKCAEAGSLREMCPEDLGGLYIEEEMQGMDAAGPPPGPGRRRSSPPPTTATVVPAGEETGDGEPVEGVVRGQGNPVDADMEEQRKRSLSKIHAIFGEHGWGGDKDPHAVEVRHLVAGGMGREEGEPPLHLTDLGELNALQAMKVAERLAQFAGVRNRDVHKALERMAGSVQRELGKAGQ